MLASGCTIVGRYGAGHLLSHPAVSDRAAAGVRVLVVFGYRGGRGSGGDANDGTVTVSSELAMPIQRQAARVMGFDEDHTSILESREVALQLNAILERARIRRGRGF